MYTAASQHHGTESRAPDASSKTAHNEPSGAPAMPLGKAAHTASEGESNREPHASPKGGLLRSAVRASHAALKPAAPVGTRGKRLGGGTRGKVVRFSPASRRRLRRLVSSTDRTEPALFVTLTQPGAGIRDEDEARALLESYKKRLGRRFGQVPLAIWKIERHLKGGLHWHMLTFSPSFVSLEDLERQMRRCWLDLTGDGSGWNRRHGFEASEEDRVWIAGYLSKKAKVGERAILGRPWGYWDRDAVHKKIRHSETPVGEREYTKLRRPQAAHAASQAPPSAPALQVRDRHRGRLQGEAGNDPRDHQ